jgi:hypothetical protein
MVKQWEGRLYRFKEKYIQKDKCGGSDKQIDSLIALRPPTLEAGFGRPLQHAISQPLRVQSSPKYAEMKDLIPSFLLMPKNN